MSITKKYYIRGALLLVGVFIILEIIARCLGLGTLPLYMLHPRIGVMFKPNQNIHIFGNHFVVNQYGMRSEPFAEKKHEFRMMVFGDSVVNGGNLTDQEGLATSLLRNLLIEKGYKEPIVGNISAGGWCPVQWLAYAEEYGFFDADIVVLIISSHDYIGYSMLGPLDENTTPTKRSFSALLVGIKRYLYPRLRKVIFKNNMKKPMLLTNNVSIEDEIKNGRHDLKEFLRLANRDTKNVFVFQYLSQAETRNFTTEPGYQRIKEVCEESGIKPISLEPYFRKSIENGVNPYRDCIHPNIIGQRIIAEAVMENLSKDAFSSADAYIKVIPVVDQKERSVLINSH